MHPSLFSHHLIVLLLIFSTTLVTFLKYSIRQPCGDLFCLQSHALFRLCHFGIKKWAWGLLFVVCVPINYIATTMQERCAGADTISLVARMLHRSKARIQSMLLQSNTAVVEDFYVHLVRSFIIFWAPEVCGWEITKTICFDNPWNSFGKNLL